MPKRFSVCLVVIARDAEGTIGRLIGSCRPWIESVLVMDTGSQDNTETVARDHGARVERMTWNDDFSEARNAALSLASAQADPCNRLRGDVMSERKNSAFRPQVFVSSCRKQPIGWVKA